MIGGMIRRWRVTLGLVGVTLLASGAWGVVQTTPAPIPDHADVRAAWRPSESQLLDRHGRHLQGRRMDFGVRRFAWTELEAISPALPRAVILAEDKEFWTHSGVDWMAVAVAAWSNLKGGRVRGASTISMQVAAMLDPALARQGGRRTVLQKIQQARAAYRLEARWPKERILEAYLNLVSYRGELQGVAAVSWLRFGKGPEGLGTAESLVLAALLPSPGAGPKRLQRRACAFGAQMTPPVPCSQLADAVNRLVRVTLDPDAPVVEHLAPHLAIRLLSRPGQRLRTTLDADLQRFVHDTLAARLGALVNRNVRDGAAVVMDIATGEILAYVASAGPNSLSPLVDGAVARRQAGSTLKPFLYGLALERRYLTAASILDDSPIRLETVNGLYVPQNYDRAFKGPVSLRTALGSSLNVPAVRALALTGVEPFRARLFALGYDGIDRDGQFYGFALALGAPEVSLMEQVAAYATLARDGRYLVPRFVSAPGKEGTSPPRAVMDKAAAFIIGDILSDRSARAMTFGLDNALTTPFWSAVKTGTSKDMRDNWAVGFTDRFVVGVWVGNFEGESMHGVSGMDGAAPVWRRIVGHLHRQQPSQAPRAPDGVETVTVHFEPPVEPARRERFLAGSAVEQVRLAAADAVRPRLINPVQGMVIAMDPDIPAVRQALLLEAQGDPDRLSFRLDGRALGTVGSRPLWRLVPGWHRLDLVDEDGRLVDQVRFQVRRGDGS